MARAGKGWGSHNQHSMAGGRIDWVEVKTPAGNRRKDIMKTKKMRRVSKGEERGGVADTDPQPKSDRHEKTGKTGKMTILTSSGEKWNHHQGERGVRKGAVGEVGDPIERSRCTLRKKYCFASGAGSVKAPGGSGDKNVWFGGDWKRRRGHRVSSRRQTGEKLD